MNAVNRKLTLAIALAATLAASGCSRQAPGTYKEPAEAAAALSAVIGTGDQKAVEVIFGPGSWEMFQSGDPVADKADAEKVKALLAEKVAFEDMNENTKILLLGNDAWPFPVPLVKQEQVWKFDSAAGREEIANRRVGRNELSTITALHAFVDAQREYATEGRDGNPPAYARRFISTEGMHDGLYWPPVEGEALSPLGDLVAAATTEGYEPGGAEPAPLHGYYFRMLEKQGPSAPGGEKSFVDEAGLMTGGFAAVAWPAKPGMSGVMTFVVNQNGIVFQKDLGAQTETIAKEMTAYDPDDTWTPTWSPEDVPEATTAAAAP